MQSLIWLRSQRVLQAQGLNTYCIQYSRWKKIYIDVIAPTTEKSKQEVAHLYQIWHTWSRILDSKLCVRDNEPKIYIFIYI